MAPVVGPRGHAGVVGVAVRGTHRIGHRPPPRGAVHERQGGGDHLGGQFPLAGVGLAGAQLVERDLLHVGQLLEDPPARLSPARTPIGIAHPGGAPSAAGKKAVGVFVVQPGQPHLLEVVAALGSPRGLACRLHRRQQQRDEDPDDRDHDEQFDERESPLQTLPLHRIPPSETGAKRYPNQPLLPVRGVSHAGGPSVNCSPGTEPPKTAGLGIR